MNDDLISRKALKADFINRKYACEDWIMTAKDEETKTRAIATRDFCNEVIMTINNAPTVKTYCYFCGQTEHGIERSQGEWNEIQAGMFVCNQCGATPHKYYKKFCANCGADMKGGAE